MASIRRRGDKWQVQVRRYGQRSAARTFQTKKDAETWARHMEVQADKGELPAQHDPRVLERITLRELVERYRDNVSPRKRGGDVERLVLNAFLRQPICNKRLSDLTAQDFAAYRDMRLGAVRPSTVQRQFAIIRHVLQVAATEWGVPFDLTQIDNVILSRPCNRRDRRLKDGEWERLVQAAGRRKHPLFLPIMRLALATGMRRGEILKIDWDHLDLRNGRLLIPTSKSGHARTIPLTLEARAVFDELRLERSPTQKVFPISANAVRLAWERTKRQAEIDDLRFHDLRHEAISRFFEWGLTVPEVTLMSGHRDSRMLFRYAHPLLANIESKIIESK